mmetsp:Transcript_33211/g.83467  ORF Transcript_33211/g.83467 Transcript_33211/m.83467 type:complete len:270 (-) Transcript_33211:352-1161(-)
MVIGRDLEGGQLRDRGQLVGARVEEAVQAAQCTCGQFVALDGSAGCRGGSRRGDRSSCCGRVTHNSGRSQGDVHLCGDATIAVGLRGHLQYHRVVEAATELETSSLGVDVLGRMEADGSPPLIQRTHILAVGGVATHLQRGGGVRTQRDLGDCDAHTLLEHLTAPALLTHGGERTHREDGRLGGDVVVRLVVAGEHGEHVRGEMRIEMEELAEHLAHTVVKHLLDGQLFGTLLQMENHYALLGQCLLDHTFDGHVRDATHKQNTLQVLR